MPTSIILLIAVALSSVSAFAVGRWTSTAFVAQRRFSRDMGKAPLWLKNFKGDAYTRKTYEALVRLFDSEKPYLRSDLTIDEVARSIGTNKQYIARAIKVYTGRNFCQFVNHHRVEYAIAKFMDNPSIRVNELGVMSGFNSSTSFSIAFKMIKGMPPGEWLRRQCKPS